MVIGADDVLLQCHVNIYTDWFFFIINFMTALLWYLSLCSITC